MPEGSWTCEQCGNINYPFRTKCNRQNCGADKPAEPENSPSPAEEENEQVCFEICMMYADCSFQISFVSVKQTCSNYVLVEQSKIHAKLMTFASANYKITIFLLIIGLDYLVCG